jgi:uncharacterized membrane protein
MDKEREYLKEEIRKEFQLERMILFSDAVFAIVITLMALEIRVTEIEHATSDEFNRALIHLIPNIVAYTASFFFIGFTWYSHLQLFSLLKDYDKGLVIRNLMLLFFIGFVPFSVSLVARPGHNVIFIVVIYFLVIMLCKVSELRLHHYILVKKPQLRLKADATEVMMRYKKSRLATAMLFIMFVLVCTTTVMIPDPELKPIAWWWFFPFPFILKYFQKRIKV